MRGAGQSCCVRMPVCMWVGESCGLVRHHSGKSESQSMVMFVWLEEVLLKA